MKPKIVILRGKPAAGKSTAYANLRKRIEMKDWLFVDNAAIKTWLGKDLGKKALFAVLKVVMPSKKNIIIEEMSRESVMKWVAKEIKKFGYKIIVFQFEVSLSKSKKRDIQRVIDKGHDRTFLLKNIEELHKMHEDKLDKKGILINTDDFGKRKVVDLILKELRLK